MPCQCDRARIAPNSFPGEPVVVWCEQRGRGDRRLRLRVGGYNNISKLLLINCYLYNFFLFCYYKNLKSQLRFIVEMEIFRDLIEIFFLHENIFSLIRNDINRLLELLLDHSQHKLERSTHP
jgi:hypothetical protein